MQCQLKGIGLHLTATDSDKITALAMVTDTLSLITYLRFIF